MRRLPLLLLLPFAGCAGGEDAPEGAGGGGAPGGFTFPVTFVPLAIGDVDETVDLVGDVEALHRARLAFERAGRVAEVAREAGDPVSAGQLLARLDDAVIAAQLAAARAAAAAAAAQAAHSTREAARARGLGETIARSERDRWDSESAIDAARAAQADAEIARLEAIAAQGELAAPFDGVLLARGVTLGSYVQAGDAAFELVDVRRLEVRLELPAALAAGVEAGGAVRLRVDGGGELSAPLLAVLPSADPGTRTFRALLRPEPAAAVAAGMRPGSFVRSSLVVRRARGAPVVPRDALLEGPQGAAVMVADASGSGPPVARLVPVAVLARDAERAAIRPLDGELAPQTPVLVTGNDNVFPGAPLRLQEHRAVGAR